MRLTTFAPNPNATQGPKSRTKSHHALSLYLRMDDRDMLQELADEEDRTLSQMIRLLLREALQARGYEDTGNLR